ncbi:hypothetical protein P8452_14154 [Trifolium repens]|nr:hypothetical protein P8452_14154 [Trifolium repens]
MSNHATINDLEMQLLFAVKNEIQVNWAYVIMHHLANHGEYSAGLPYARVLTKIFRKFKVNLTSESIAKMEPSECAITSDVVNSKMGVVYDLYLKTYNYITHNADDEVAPPPPPPQQHAGEPTNQMIMDFRPKALTGWTFNLLPCVKNLEVCVKIWPECPQEWIGLKLIKEEMRMTK